MEAAAARPYVAPGELVAGKYLVERALGAGGVAFVVSARHVELGERFALKFLNEQFLGDPSVIERFTREARAACKIQSEHVARVFDVGTHRGVPYLVMEHLEGRDLCAVLAERGPLPIEQAVEHAMQACEALAAAHSHGIVHRDVKPENLFLVEHGGLTTLKLLDFGISKLAPAGAPSRLTGDLTLGTTCYMSP
jgi:serine/threonine-protein kinase